MMENYKVLSYLHGCLLASAFISFAPVGTSAWADEPNLGGNGQPGNQGTSVSRGICADTRPPIALTALVPRPQATQTAPKEIQTVSDHPTVWVYMPYVDPTAKKITFVLQTLSGQEIYSADLPIPSRSGIVKITIPEQAPTLKVGETYEWYYMVYCNDTTNEPDAAIGRIQRVALDPAVEQRLAIAKTSLEKSQDYASAGIWYEALTVLANELKQKPDDPALRQAWSKLLKYNTVNLGAFESQPFLP